MPIKFFADDGPFDEDLQIDCIILAIVMLAVSCILLIRSVVTKSPSDFGETWKFVLFLIISFLMIFCNLALFFGALWFNKWLVSVWFIEGIFMVIYVLIALLGSICNLDGFREEAFFDNIALILIEYIIYLICTLYVTHFVFSFWYHLHTNQTIP